MEHRAVVSSHDTPFFCSACAAPRPRNICWKCGGAAHTPPFQWTNPLLPNVPLIQEVGKTAGYAIAIHGSLQRDVDLIAIPWTDDAELPMMLIERLCKAMDARQLGEGELKPFGRMAYTLQMNGWFKPIDLSIMPPRRHVMQIPDPSG